MAPEDFLVPVSSSCFTRMSYSSLIWWGVLLNILICCMFGYLHGAESVQAGSHKIRNSGSPKHKCIDPTFLVSKLAFPAELNKYHTFLAGWIRNKILLNKFVIFDGDSCQPEGMHIFTYFNFLLVNCRKWRTCHENTSQYSTIYGHSIIKSKLPQPST